MAQAVMTSNWALPAYMVHALGILGALVVFLGSDAEFIKLLPPAVAVIMHAVIPFLTYLGVTQVKSEK